MDQATTPNPTLANKKLGLLLSTAPDNPNAETVYQLSKTALANKVDTYLYFIDEGVLNLKDPRFAELANGRIKTLCLRLRLPTAPHLNGRLWQRSELLRPRHPLQHHRRLRPVLAFN